MTTELFDGYDTDGFFDEAFLPDGGVRPHYRSLVDRFADVTALNRLLEDLYVGEPAAVTGASAVPG